MESKDSTYETIISMLRSGEDDASLALKYVVMTDSYSLTEVFSDIATPSKERTYLRIILSPDNFLDIQSTYSSGRTSLYYYTTDQHRVKKRYYASFSKSESMKTLVRKPLEFRSLQGKQPINFRDTLKRLFEAETNEE